MTLEDHVGFLIRLRDEFGIVPDYERILAAQFRRFLTAGSVVIDAGANLGEHTARFASMVRSPGQIWAFEPIPSLFEQLSGRFACPDVIKLFPIALSNRDGESKFVVARGCLPESGLRQRLFSIPAAANPVEIRVQVRRLDGLTGTLSQLDYIKIDVEGGELDVLDGARATIRRLRPVISVEYGYAGYSVYGHQRGDLSRYCTEMGYVLMDLFGNVIPDEATWDRVCDRVYWDYFCVPQERLAWFKDRVGPRPQEPRASVF